MYSNSISTPSLTGTTLDDTRFARQPSPTNNLPGYIDPTQVYNPYRQEYERMKAAEAEAEAEAEAQKQAEKEQEAANQAAAQTQDTAVHDHSNCGGTEQDNTHSASHSHSYPVPPTPEKKKRGQAPRKSAAAGANASGSNATTKKSLTDATEQNIDPLLRSAPQTGSAQTDGNDDSGEIDMESELKLMMQRMQEWRSKDPSRFAKLIDVLKKDPAPKGTATETPSQNGDGEATASTAPAASTTTPNQPSTKSRGSNAHLIDGLPDLGRFPAQRRRRCNKHKGNGSTGDVTAFSQSPGSVLSMTAASFGNTFTQPAEPIRPDSSSASILPDAPSAASNNAHNETPTPSVVANEAHNDPQTPTPATGNTQNGAPSTADGPSTASNEAPTSVPSEAGNKAHEAPNTEQPTKQASEQPKGEPQKPGMTIWSEPKRQAVAKATSQYLVAIPANRDKTGSVEMILSLIDSNPSYIELCEQIEARGYVINRSSLAKHLLATVPDLSSNAPQPPQHKPDRNFRVILQPPPGSINRVQPQKPVQGQPQMVVWKNPPIAHVSTMPAPPATTGPVPAPAPAPVPGPPPGSLPASGHLPAPGPGPVHGPPPPAPFPAAPPLQPRPSPVSLPLHRPPPPSVRPGAKRSRPRAPPPAPPPDSKAARARKHLFSEIVDLSALSDDEDADRAAKEPRLEGPSQEPQADISVAKAQQPQKEQKEQTDLPQTAVPQTAAPQSNSEHTSSQMNLSRFAFSPNEASRKEALRHRNDIVKPLNKAEALRRNFYNPKTIARDVLIAAGRHPTERPLNHHLLWLRDIFLMVDYTSDMETFRWDLVDPGGPPMPVVEPEDVALLPPTYPLGTRKKGPRVAESREMRDAADAASSDGPPKSNVTAVTPHEHKSSNLSISCSFDDDISPATPPTRPEKKRDERRDEKHVTPMARPASSTPSSSVPSTRRRGRPPGAKNKLPTKAALRAAGASGSKIEVAIPVPSPPRTFSVYRCDWENCQAELHDLATLERHVAKIHAPSSSSDHTCRWLGCSRSQKRFSSSTELRRHLQADHVGPIAWKLGDGPSVRPTVIESERYLNDSSGSAITPDASSTTIIQPDDMDHDHDIDQDIDSDSLIFPAGYTPIRAYNRVHGNHSNPEKARAVLEAVERMKVRIGPGLEQGGCEIANPVRMSGVGNDEGVFRLVGSQG
ncbi:hypothetical protein VTN00DRAFT_7565 [Thermoascus crustaceus]|uniref:uncharacterized protein n=1 Tax=Thermoascus crustaceus TaxID=5088 RepID=UPI0037446A0A